MKKVLTSQIWQIMNQLDRKLVNPTSVRGVVYLLGLTFLSN